MLSLPLRLGLSRLLLMEWQPWSCWIILSLRCFRFSLLPSGSCVRFTQGMIWVLSWKWKKIKGLRWQFGEETKRSPWSKGSTKRLMKLIALPETTETNKFYQVSSLLSKSVISGSSSGTSSTLDLLYLPLSSFSQWTGSWWAYASPCHWPLTSLTWTTNDAGHSTFDNPWSSSPKKSS